MEGHMGWDGVGRGGMGGDGGGWGGDGGGWGGDGGGWGGIGGDGMGGGLWAAQNPSLPSVKQVTLSSKKPVT